MPNAKYVLKKETFSKGFRQRKIAWRRCFQKSQRNGMRSGMGSLLHLCSLLVQAATFGGSVRLMKSTNIRQPFPIEPGRSNLRFANSVRATVLTLHIRLLRCIQKSQQNGTRLLTVRYFQTVSRAALQRSIGGAARRTKLTSGCSQPTIESGHQSVHFAVAST